MPTTQIHCLGLNHRTAPVELREMFAAPLVDPDSVLYRPGEQHAHKGVHHGEKVPPSGGCPYHSKGRTSGDLIRERRNNGNGNGEGPARVRRANSRRPDDKAFALLKEVAVFATCNRAMSAPAM